MKIRVGGNMKRLKLHRVSVGRVGQTLEVRFDTESSQGMTPVTMEIENADSSVIGDALRFLLRDERTSSAVAEDIVDAMRTPETVLRRTIEDIIVAQSLQFRVDVLNGVREGLQGFAERGLLTSKVVEDVVGKIRKITLEEEDNDNERCCRGR